MARSGEHSLREYLMTTDPETKKMLAAPGKDFTKGVAAAHGDKGAYALARFAKTATAEQKAISAAIIAIQGR